MKADVDDVQMLTIAGSNEDNVRVYTSFDSFKDDIRDIIFSTCQISASTEITEENQTLTLRSIKLNEPRYLNVETEGNDGADLINLTSENLPICLPQKFRFERPLTKTHVNHWCIKFFSLNIEKFFRKIFEGF